MTEQRTHEPQPRNVVVSGGGTGIGRAIAERFAEDGDTVVIVGRRRDVLDGAAAQRPNIVPFVADCTEPEQLHALAAELERRGGVDVVVANAGGTHRGPLETLEQVAEHWRATVDANVLSAVLLEFALRPLLRNGGRFVAISSTSASYRVGGEVAYASSKSAINRWIGQLATDLGGKATANVVSPGFVPDTEIYESPVDEATRARTAGLTPVQRVGTPEDIAAVVHFLASPEAGFVSGNVFDVDGGRKVPTVRPR
jgi:3-oxoacyl-[acyl-carrier protein] reductase